MNAKLKTLLLLAALLSGCAIPVQGPTQAQLWKQESADMAKLYRERLEEKRQLDPIRDKIALASARDTTFAMLANNNRPDERERAAILEFAKIREAFVHRAQAINEQYQAPFRKIYIHQAQAGAAILADLYNSSITYGEFSKRRQEIDATANEAADRMRSAITSESQAAEQVSLQRLNTYLILQQSLQQQRSRSVPEPIAPQTIRLQTTCNKIGEMLFCN